MAYKALYGYVEGCEFIHFLDPPYVLHTVPAVMAIGAQGNRRILLSLLNMVGLRRAGRIANRASQFFNPPQVLALFLCQLVIHVIPFSRSCSDFTSS